MILDIEYALMAGGSYISNRSEINQFPVPYGWTEFNEKTTSSGFEAVSFRNGNDIVISFAGTDPSSLGDLWADLRLASGSFNSQYGFSLCINTFMAKTPIRKGRPMCLISICRGSFCQHRPWPTELVPSVNLPGSAIQMPIHHPILAVGASVLVQHGF